MNQTQKQNKSIKPNYDRYLAVMDRAKKLLTKNNRLPVTIAGKPAPWRIVEGQAYKKYLDV